MTERPCVHVTVWTNGPDDDGDDYDLRPERARPLRAVIRWLEAKLRAVPEEHRSTACLSAYVTIEEEIALAVGYARPETAEETERREVDRENRRMIAEAEKEARLAVRLRTTMKQAEAQALWDAECARIMKVPGVTAEPAASAPPASAPR